MKSYYEILGVSENASQKEIKEKYRQYALKMHPDRLIDKPKEEVEKIQKQFQEITNAYQTLSDENERKKYDYQRKASSSFGFDGFSGGQQYGGFGGSADIDLEDIFESFFGGSTRSRNWSSGSYNRSSSVKSGSLEVLLTISFKDLVLGSKKNFTLDLNKSCSACSQTGAFSDEYIKLCLSCNGRGFVESIRKTFLGSIKTQSECKYCRGSGKIITKKCAKCNGSRILRVKEEFEIKIPRGIKPGQRITLKARGNDEIGKARGDLVIEINLKNHSLFKRKDNEIHCSVPVSFFDAILGNKIKVPTIEGVQEVDIPKNSQFGDFIVLKSKGFYVALNSDKRGDFYVWLDIKIPKKINQQGEELIKKIYESSSWNPNEDFIKKIEV